MIFILSALWWVRIRGLWKLPDGRNWLWGILGLVLMGVAMLSKSLIQLSVDGQSYVPSLLSGLRPNYGRGNEGNGNLQQDLCMHCCSHTVNSFVHTLQQSLSTHASARLLDTHRQVWLCLLWGQCFFLLAPGIHKVLFYALQGSVSPVLWKFCNQISLAFKVKFPGGSQSFCQTPRLGNLLWVLLWEFIGITVM